MLILFVAVAVVLGIFVAIRPVWRPQGLHESVPLPKKPWLLVVAVVVQALWVRWLSNLGPSAEVFSWILPASYLPVIYFLASNIRTSWAPVVALGVGLNLMVMIVNGGTMPAPARFASDQAKIALHAEPLAPASKDRFVGGELPTVFAPLEDQYVITLPNGQRRLASIGDFVSLGGGVIALLSVI